MSPSIGFKTNYWSIYCRCSPYSPYQRHFCITSDLFGWREGLAGPIISDILYFNYNCDPKNEDKYSASPVMRAKSKNHTECDRDEIN